MKEILEQIRKDQSNWVSKKDIIRTLKSVFWNNAQPYIDYTKAI